VNLFSFSLSWAITINVYHGKMNHSSFTRIGLCLILLIFLAFGSVKSRKTTGAQKVIVDGVIPVICGCSSSTYTFVLDFGLSCATQNITIGSGVSSVSCLISPFGAPTTNLDPVLIDSISVIELDQFNNVIVEERIKGDFLNGDSFSYSSILNNPDDDITISSRQIPRALQLNLNGKNKEGIMLLNVFVLQFSNECGVYPIIQNGDSVGWSIFSQMTGPMLEFCPTRSFSPSSDKPSLFDNNEMSMSMSMSLPTTWNMKSSQLLEDDFDGLGDFLNN